MPDGMPPQISLRALREALGLTLDELADRINEQGVSITKFALSNVETGKRRASDRLMDAWTKALNTRTLHVRQDRELRAWVRAWDRSSKPQQMTADAA
ncbi:helix-turn-helix domain-containing protein [Micromonospora carbonacea]|uniref:helix-turn-helix domain-containing protein n=1 Tax=Micromonospora carbonacea TaxID=47853 RepID=UPI003720608E